MPDFIWTRDSEPHAKERHKIIQKYPGIKSLAGSEYKSKYISFIIVVALLTLSVTTSKMSFINYVSCVYIVGGTLMQSLFLAIHELSHNLFFDKMVINRFYAMFCNLPIIFPFTESFRFHHIRHHVYQGVDNVDSDIPSKIEAILFRHTIGKAIWYNFQLIFYALRPVFTTSQPFTKYLAYNIIIQCTFNLLFYQIYGIQPFIFLLSSMMVAGGMGFHPLSAHFISEHYIFDKKTNETYDYHGVLNSLTWNVGYHRTHHNHPNIPWTRLKSAHDMSIEFYNPHDVHSSWLFLPIKFIFYKDISLYSRVKRQF